jgi:hypothetical protein
MRTMVQDGKTYALVWVNVDNFYGSTQGYKGKFIIDSIDWGYADE